MICECVRLAHYWDIVETLLRHDDSCSLRSSIAQNFLIPGCIGYIILSHVHVFINQVLSLEDIERLLGPRPYKSDELRNIDKYRFGREGIQDAPPNEETLDSGEGTPPSQDGGEESDVDRTSSQPSKIVAT